MHKLTVAAIVLASAAFTLRAADRQKIVFARVFPNEGQIGLYVSNADGSGEHLLLGKQGIDYDPAWSPDGKTIVFTSDRDGSADLFRVNTDGSAIEKLTDSTAYDDQAAFSPDGTQVVFVTTRGAGYANLWTLDLQTKRAKPLTSGEGGDFRPSWSPDGQWIAFASDRGSTMPFGRGRWEHLQLADVYVVHPDGSALARVSEHGDFCGSPKWTADSRAVVGYCMTAEQTLESRRPSPLPGNDTRLVRFDIATKAATEMKAGAGLKFNPWLVAGTDLAYIRKDSAAPGIYYASGARGPQGQIRSASWSPDGRRVAYHKRLDAPPTTWKPIWSRNPEYELTLTGILPSFSPDGEHFVFTTRPAQGTVLGASVAMGTPGSNAFTVVYQDKTRNVLAPTWTSKGDQILFGFGVFNAFFNGFNAEFMKPSERSEGGAQIAVVNADGSGFHMLTSGDANNGFPSMSPDGKRFVYRSFGPDGQGLRIMNVESHRITSLTEGYDNFPLWSPRGDLIMFSRFADGDYEIYTIKPDGTGAKRLTRSRGNDAHQSWSPDGGHIVFASSRMGFKDEVIYTNAPQPYGELFVMRFDGSDVQQLTDNQWEDGTPAWQPSKK